ncbi:MAG: LPS export ABC transporter periplasmic protein LptC [Aquabacterium sp.]
MTAATAPPPPPELHLPDLEDVAVRWGDVGIPARRGRSPAQRLRDAAATYLPLLLMALLAAATGWLLQHTPGAEPPATPKAPRQGVDYAMHGFSVTRFDAAGHWRVRVEGDVLRHYPETDRMEVDQVRIQSLGAEGRVTHARARRAVANADASEIQLFGGAQVRSEQPGAAVLEIESEFLHVFLRQERLRSHLPVRVQRTGSIATAGGIEYDHLSRQLRLAGPVRITLQPGTGDRP